MSKRQFLMLLGLWTIIFLFLGFPSRWDKIFAIVTGVLVIVVASRIRSPRVSGGSDNMPYVDHRNDIKNSSQNSSQNSARSMDSIISNNS